jgi:hypothetical protein
MQQETPYTAAIDIGLLASVHILALFQLSQQR